MSDIESGEAHSAGLLDDLQLGTADRRLEGKVIVDDLVAKLTASRLAEKAELVKSVLDLYEIVIQQKLEVVQLTEQLTFQMVKTIEQENRAAKAPSFADVTRDNTTDRAEPVQVPKRPSEHVVLVYPEHPGKDSGPLRTKLKKAISPKNLKIAINDIKNIKGGGLLVKTGSAEAAKTLEETIRGNNDLKGVITKLPSKRKPRIIIYNVQAEAPETEVLEALREKYTFSEQPSHKFNIKGREGHHVVLELAPSDFNTVMKDKKVNIGWKRTTITEYLRATQCFKCTGYGHVAANCSQQQRCMTCGKKGHSWENCQKDPHCRQCETANKHKKQNYRTDHSAKDQTCPCRKFEIELLRKRVDYG